MNCAILAFAEASVQRVQSNQPIKSHSLGFLERTVCSSFGTNIVLVASCTIAPQRLRPINILRIPVGDHLPAYNSMPATIASMAKLRARASVHSTIGSLRRKKRTSTMPGQTKRNQNTTIGHSAVPVNAKFTRPAATAERMIIVGHNQFDSDGLDVAFGWGIDETAPSFFVSMSGTGIEGAVKSSVRKAD